MAKGLYKCIVGVAAEDIADCGSMQLPAGVTLSAVTLVDIDAKQTLRIDQVNRLVFICSADTATKGVMLVSRSSEVLTT